jgi:hypothetical protein
MDALLSQISAKYAAAEARIRELEARLAGSPDRRAAEMELKISTLEFNLERKSELLDAECRLTHELKTKLAALEANPRIRGHDEAEIVVAVMKIARGIPDATERQVLEAWRSHAAEVAEDEAARDRVDAAGPGSGELRSWFADWLAAGTPQRRRLCCCLDWDCPTKALVYRADHGFVDSWYEQQGSQGGVKESMRHCLCSGIGVDVCHKCSSLPEEAEAAAAAGAPSGAAGGGSVATVPAAPAPKKTWAQVAGQPKRK